MLNLGEHMAVKGLDLGNHPPRLKEGGSAACPFGKLGVEGCIAEKTVNGLSQGLGISWGNDEAAFSVQINVTRSCAEFGAHDRHARGEGL